MTAMVFAFAAILAGLVSCAQPPPDLQPLKIGIVTWPGFASGVVAQEKGFFGEQKYDNHGGD